MPPTSATSQGRVDWAPSDAGFSVEECLQKLSPTAREDYRAVIIQGVPPSERAETRDVYASTICENVRRAQEEIQKIVSNEGAFPRGPYEVSVHPVGGREPDGSASAIGRWTFRTKIVRDVVEDALEGRVLNACAGQTALTHGGGEIIRNDVNPDVNADHHLDICSLDGSVFEARSFDTVVLDPPFDQSNAEKHYEGWHASDLAAARENLAKLVRPGGRLIELGWNSHGATAFDGWARDALHLFQRGPCLPDMFCTIDQRVQFELDI